LKDIIRNANQMGRPAASEKTLHKSDAGGFDYELKG